MNVLNSLTFSYFAFNSQPILSIHWPRRSVKFQTNKRLSRSVPNFSCFKKQVVPTFFIAGSGFTLVKTTPSRKSAKKKTSSDIIYDPEAGSSSAEERKTILILISSQCFCTD